MRTTILAVCATATIITIGGDARYRYLHSGDDGIVQTALFLRRRLQFGPSSDDCPAKAGEPNANCELSGSGSDTSSNASEDDSSDNGPLLLGKNPISSGQHSDDGCGYSWGTPQNKGCTNSPDSDEGPAMVGVNPDDARFPSMLRLKLYREHLKLRRNKRKLERLTKNREYSFEYFLEEYRVQRRGLRGSRGLQNVNFRDIEYTRVRVTDGGVVRPIGHKSASNLLSHIESVIQDARGDPSKLGHYRLVYSRRFGLPRFVYIEFDSMATKIAARRLKITNSASPTT
jgi:hypothetical protein